LITSIILFIVLAQILSLSTSSYNLQGFTMSKSESTSHPAFAIWLPTYMPSAEQDTEYDVDDSGDSPMLDHQELPEEAEHSFTLSHSFLSQNQSALSLNMSINDSGVFFNEPNEPAALNMTKKHTPQVSVSQRYTNVLSILCQGGLSPIRLMTMIANVMASEYEMYQVKMYENSANL
jgi:hypothetical protein